MSQLSRKKRARRGQETPSGYYNLERMLSVVFRGGRGQVLLCGSCMSARGLTDADVVEGVRRSTMDELAAETASADKVLVFQPREHGGNVMNPDTHQQMLARVAMLIRGTELAEFDISRDQKLRLALQHSRGRRPAPVA